MRDSRFFLRVLLCVAMTSSIGSWTRADTPRQFSYQGYLRGSDGQPVSRAVNFQFYIFPDSVGGSPCWGPESHLSVNVVEGLFELALGSSVPITPGCFDGSLKWLETWVDGAPLHPRKSLGSVPYVLGADASFVAHNNGVDILIPNGVETKLLFTSEEFDPANSYDASTGRFQPHIPGTYCVSVQVMMHDPSNHNGTYQLMISGKSGINDPRSTVNEPNGVECSTCPHQRTTLQTSKLIRFDGSTDYVEFYVYQSNLQLAAETLVGSANASWVSAYRVDR